jgi:hypothetical protein
MGSGSSWITRLIVAIDYHQGFTPGHDAQPARQLASSQWPGCGPSPGLSTARVTAARVSQGRS